ncbi:hypothetical protein PESP_b0245 [Pseudoalteromonas espejiana DSM 9414]|nr:hypothetical protein PESP_b0245 [Pseudoalteromonas espejiana DSM 9414]
MASASKPHLVSAFIEPVLPANTAPKIRFRFEFLKASLQICVIAWVIIPCPQK